jgi:hypothetical protein
MGRSDFTGLMHLSNPKFLNDPLKFQYISIRVHVLASQNMTHVIATVMRTSHLQNTVPIHAQTSVYTAQYQSLPFSFMLILGV